MVNVVAEDFWDRNAGKHREPFAHWESPAPILAALNTLVTGDPNTLPPAWFVDKYGPFQYVADLGCGDGILVEFLASICPHSRIVGYDFSAGSIDASRQRCSHFTNVEFQKIDLNVEVLPRSCFDAIFTTGSMHHIEQLDHCFASMAASLQDHGLLWLNDYVGPARFQWSDTHMRLANDLLTTVPSQWRLCDTVTRYAPDLIQSIDPSEAVASHQIEDALLAHFHIVEQFERGGTLLMPIFGSSCLSATMADSQEGLIELQRLYERERDFISGGAIKSLNRQYVARPRKI